MNNIGIIALMCLGSLSIVPSRAGAEKRDEKTLVTFTAPVEIHGQVLSAGTYVFRLADSEVNRDIVQVLDENETHLYNTFLTKPRYLVTLVNKPAITFEERPAGSPEAVKAWFIRGDNYARDFVYRKARNTLFLSTKRSH